MPSQAAGAGSSDPPPLVFVSYSHADARWLDRLRVHLKPLVRDGAIALWEDTQIMPGTPWREEIRRALDRARVAVLFITADFLASDFISSNELPPLLKAAEEKGTLILPVILKPSRFEKTEGLANFQAVNSPSKPLSSLPPDRREELWVRLSGIIEDALTSRPPDAAPPAEGEPAGEKKELARRHVLRYRFWQQLLELAKQRGLHLHANRAPATTSWIGAGAGRSGYSWNYVIRMNDAAVELDIDTGNRDENKRAFDALQERKAEIEAAFGAALEWQRLDEKRRCGIRHVVTAGGLVTPEARWPAIQAAMVEAMERLSRALQPYLIEPRPRPAPEIGASSAPVPQREPAAPRAEQARLESRPQPTPVIGAPSSPVPERAPTASPADQAQLPEPGIGRYYHAGHDHWDECIYDENGNCINDNQKHWGANE
jgi:Domain of unknown function (DUF4268)/TIR domain